MNLKAIYHTLCATGDPATVLDRMGDGTLAALARHLSAGGVNSGIPAIVAGLVDLEIVTRWTRDNAPQGGAVGEGATVGR